MPLDTCVEMCQMHVYSPERGSPDPVLVMAKMPGKPPAARSGWGGPRKNSGGARPNSGGARPNCGGPQPGSGRPRKVIAPPVQIVGPRWFCIVAEIGRDVNAFNGVSRLGHPAWMMLRHVPARPERRIDGRRVAARPAHVLPAIPGYFFARFDPHLDAWRRIASVNGVDRILGPTPERPQPIADAAMALMQAQCNEHGVLLASLPVTRQRPVVVGERVTIGGDGPFAGLQGLCQWSNHRRVQIVLSALGLKVDVAREEVV